MTIILCGLPKSGKTTIGQLIAARLNWNFIDTDCLIEQAYRLKKGKNFTCRQICFWEGELYFRELEKEQILSLMAPIKSVIALGGGSLCDSENVKKIQSIGHLIYLKTPLSIIWTRIEKQGIPAYLDQANPKKNFDEIAAKRLALYEKIADDSIDTNHLSEQEIVTAILMIRKL